MDLGAWIIMTDMTMMIDRFWGLVVSQIEANPFSNYIKVKKLKSTENQEFSRDCLILILVPRK